MAYGYGYQPSFQEQMALQNQQIQGQAYLQNQQFQQQQYAQNQARNGGMTPNAYGGYTMTPPQTQYAPDGLYGAMASVMNNQNTNQTQYGIAEGNANAEMARLMQQLLYNQGQTIYRTGFEDQWNQRQNDTSRYLADQNLAGQLGVANTNMQGQLGVAGINSQTALGTAGINAGAQNYATDANRQVALGGQQNALNISTGQNQAAIQQANIAANASTLPHVLRDQRFNNSIMPLMNQLFFGPGGSPSPAPSPAPAPVGTTQGSPGMVDVAQAPQATSPNQIVAGPPGRAPMTAYESALTNNRQAMLDLNRFRQHDPNIFGTEANIGRQQNAQVVNAQRGPNAPPAMSTMGQRPQAPFVQSQRSANPAVANSSFRVGQSPPSMASTRFPGTVPQGQYPGAGTTGRPTPTGAPVGAQPPSTRPTGVPAPGATTNGPAPNPMDSMQPLRGGGTQPIPSQPYITPQNELFNRTRYASAANTPSVANTPSAPAQPSAPDPRRSLLIDPVQGAGGGSPSASPFSSQASPASSAPSPAEGSARQDRLNAQNQAAAQVNGQTWTAPVATPAVADVAPTSAPAAPTPSAAAASLAADPPASGGLLGGGLLGLLGGSSSSSGGTAVGTQPTIPYAPPSNPQMWEQQVNQEIGRNAAAMAGQNNDVIRSMAARYGANSPALQSILNQNNARLAGLNQQARTSIPMAGQQALSNYSLNYGQAAENQYANRQREALQRQQLSIGSIAPLLNALAGFAG